MSLVSQSNQRLKVHGTDRLAHVKSIGGLADGTVILDVVLDAQSIPRLAKLSDAYQRVQFHKLVFRIEPMAATSTVGGLVAGFVPDAQDRIGSGDRALARVLAVSGSKLFKAWQSVSVVHNCVPDLLYTSLPPKGEARLSSPGRFVVVVDSKVVGTSSGEIPMSVYLDWWVTLLEPSLEQAEGESNAPIVAEKSFYLRASNVGLWWKDDAGGDDPRTAIPGIQFNQMYRLPSKRFVDFTDTTATGDEQIGSFDRVRMTNDATHGVTLWVVDYNGKDIPSKPSKNQWFLERGDVLHPEAPPNLQRGAQYLCRPLLKKSCAPKPRPLSMSSESLDALSEDFENL